MDYELLRNGPTQSGVAYPKFYLWLRATNTEKTVIEGAVRVAAIEKKRFDVTNFIPRTYIVSHPEAVAGRSPNQCLRRFDQCRSEEMTTEMSNTNASRPGAIGMISLGLVVARFTARLDEVTVGVASL